MYTTQQLHYKMTPYTNIGNTSNHRCQLSTKTDDLEPVTCTASSSQIYAKLACNMASIIWNELL